jgi:N-dimethylarginine dimethylaminohydrolase
MYRITLEKMEDDYFTADNPVLLRTQFLINEYMMEDMRISEEEALIEIFKNVYWKLKSEQMVNKKELITK